MDSDYKDRSKSRNKDKKDKDKKKKKKHDDRERSKSHKKKKHTQKQRQYDDGYDRERERQHKSAKHRERSVQIQRQKYREKDQDREEKDRDYGRERQKEKQKDRERERDKDKQRERQRDKDKERQKNREKDRQKQRGKQKDREKDREKDKQRGKDKQRDRDRQRDGERQRDKERQRDRDRDREKQRQRQKQRQKQKQRQRERQRQRQRQKQKQRVKPKDFDKEKQKHHKMDADQAAHEGEGQRMIDQKSAEKTSKKKKRKSSSPEKKRSRREKKQRADSYQRSRSRDKKKKKKSGFDRHRSKRQSKVSDSSSSESSQQNLSDDPEQVQKLAQMKAAKQLVSSKADRKLYLGNLPPNITSQQLMDMLNGALKKMEINTEIEGDSIVSAWISPDGVGHYAFVQFRSAQEATNGLTLNGASLFGYQLKLGRPKQYIEYNKTLLSEMGTDRNLETILKKVAALGAEVLPPIQQRIVYPPSKIIALKYIVSIEELAIDEQFEQILYDVREMAQRFGEVVDIVIPRPHQIINLELAPKRVKGLGLIFIEYKELGMAKFARSQFVTKSFSGQPVACCFFDEQQFRAQQYDMQQKVIIDF